VGALLVTVFAAALALVVGGYRFLMRRRLAVEQAARERLTTESATQSATVLVKDEEAASALPFLNRVLANNEFTPKIAAQLKKAGLTMTPGAFLLLSAVSALVGVFLLSRWNVFGMLIGGMMGAMAPRSWLRWKIGKRMDEFDQQLPGAIDMLVSALKTGYSFHVASNFLGQELAPPLGAEFARIYDEQRLGVDPASALLGMQERIATVEMKMFVTALLIQRKTGGNLSEILTNAADVMRERMDVKRQLDTLTAEAKWSGRLLAALPVLVFFGLSWIAPKYIHDFTGSIVGEYMLAAATLAVMFGYWIMMNIAKVDF
jgi:tight adherence protein B